MYLDGMFDGFELHSVAVLGTGKTGNCPGPKFKRGAILVVGIKKHTPLLVYYYLL